MNAFDKVIGYDAIKKELIRFADVLKNIEKYKKLGVTLPSGILLSGDPGLGKTLMAKCFIEESGCKSVTLRKDKSNGYFVDEIKKTYESAKEMAPCIVFLDDMDKFANEDYAHRDAEEYVTVQACIDEYKEYGVFTLATVNEKYCLPDSLLRVGRFDETIDVVNPRGEDAVKIIEYYLNQKNTVGDIDIIEISRLMAGKSCAELETVINKAGIYAGFDGRDKINQSDIVNVWMRMEFNSPECVNTSGLQNNRSIAIHEAGHAVVHELLDPGSVTIVSICRHDGQTGGITKWFHEDDFNLYKKLIEHSIVGSLAGMAATEIVLGETDIGCDSDIRKARDMIENLIVDACSEGFNSFRQVDSSQYLLENRDRLIASEMERYYRMAKKMILNNREFLDVMIDALMEHNTVTYREMQNLSEKYVFT